MFQWSFDKYDILPVAVASLRTENTEGGGGRR